MIATIHKSVMPEDGRQIANRVHYAMKVDRELSQEQRPEVIGGQNVLDGCEVDDESIYRAMEEMEANFHTDDGPPYRSGRPIENRCHHMSLNWPEGHNPSNEHMAETARDALKALGMERAKSVFVRHRDTDNHHAHLVSSRINPETKRIFPAENQTLKRRYRAIQKWARGYERQHEHERINLLQMAQGEKMNLAHQETMDLGALSAAANQPPVTARRREEQQQTPVAHRAKNEMEMV